MILEVAILNGIPHLFSDPALTVRARLIIV
jgi:hypothetical protein